MASHSADFFLSHGLFRTDESFQQSVDRKYNNHALNTVTISLQFTLLDLNIDPLLRLLETHSGLDALSVESSWWCFKLFGWEVQAHHSISTGNWTTPSSSKIVTFTKLTLPIQEFIDLINQDGVMTMSLAGCKFVSSPKFEMSHLAAAFGHSKKTWK